MFDQEIWRNDIRRQLAGFARNPQQDLQLSGAGNLLSYLALRTLEPLQRALETEPVNAVQALAQILDAVSANQLVRRMLRLRFRGPFVIARELVRGPELRRPIEQLLIELQVVSLMRQQLNAARDEWLCQLLTRELDHFPGEFLYLRRAISDAGWQTRYEAIRSLRSRDGHFQPEDVTLLQEALRDTTSYVRGAAARMIGTLRGVPTATLARALIKTALYDSDLETRYAAARALGNLREFPVTPQLLDHLAMCLADGDHYVRSAAALVLGELGPRAAAPGVTGGLLILLRDRDAYAREAAARALGRLGSSIISSEVLLALSRAVQDDDASVHEAAAEALARLRQLSEVRETPSLSVAA